MRKDGISQWFKCVTCQFKKGQLQIDYIACIFKGNQRHGQYFLTIFLLHLLEDTGRSLTLPEMIMLGKLTNFEITTPRHTTSGVVVGLIEKKTDFVSEQRSTVEYTANML